MTAAVPEALFGVPALSTPRPAARLPGFPLRLHPGDQVGAWAWAEADKTEQMSLLSSAARFARSPQGRKALEQAKRLASDPKNKQKLEQLRQRLASRPPRG